MTIEISKRDEIITVLRASGFNCFPVPAGQKAADYRYQSEKTKTNQPVLPNENFGVIPIEGTGTCIVDFDDKDFFREKIEVIAKKYMVTESPHGFHWYVKGLTGSIQKVMLYNDEKKPGKQIIDIQGFKHYCVGATSTLIEDGETIEYKNIGTDIVFSASCDFNDFIDSICEKFDVTGKEKSRDAYYQMRQRFKEGKIPTPGTSNDYFFQAALWCNTEGLSRNEAEQRITRIFFDWKESSNYSGRPWSNIQTKIDDVYDNDKKYNTLGGRPVGDTASGLDRTEIATKILEKRKLYSDTDTNTVFEDVNGFLENISGELHRELVTEYPKMETQDLGQIIFKLVGLAKKIPEANKDLIVFKNGRYSRTAGTLIESEDLAEMGFRDYNYLEKSPENEPVEFKKILFQNIPEEEYPRVRAGLRAILYPYLDSRISVIHGMPGTGKSTGLLILHRILGQYSEVFELDQLLSDRFIKAKIKGKQLIILQDLPYEFKDFAILKTLTGEQYKQERGFMQDSTTFENKIKIWASCNNLAKIPVNEKSPMYNRRLSLIHNTRSEPYPQDPTLIERIIKDEGEKILSWILNLSDQECSYEDGKTVRREWEKLASPEVDYIESHYDLTDSDGAEISVMRVKKECELATGLTFTLQSFKKALNEMGFIINFNIIKNIKKLDLEPKNGVLD